MDANGGRGGPAGPRHDGHEAPIPIRIDLMLEIRDHVDATLDDFARSVRRDRPITLPNLRRLFARRWARATWRPEAPADRIYRLGLAYGRTRLAEAYRDVCAGGSRGPAGRESPGATMTWSPRW